MRGESVGGSLLTLDRRGGLVPGPVVPAAQHLASQGVHCKHKSQSAQLSLTPGYRPYLAAVLFSSVLAPASPS